MTNGKAIKDLEAIHKMFCKWCEERGKKDIDICFKCPWHKKFNDVANSLNGR